ncbi:MAG: hypothetical protein ABGY11_01005, partial [Candidatus Thioglobus sp.]
MALFSYTAPETQIKSSAPTFKVTPNLGLAKTLQSITSLVSTGGKAIGQVSSINKATDKEQEALDKAEQAILDKEAVVNGIINLQSSMQVLRENSQDKTTGEQVDLGIATIAANKAFFNNQTPGVQRSLVTSYTANQTTIEKNNLNIVHTEKVNTFNAGVVAVPLDPSDPDAPESFKNTLQVGESLGLNKANVAGDVWESGIVHFINNNDFVGAAMDHDYSVVNGLKDHLDAMRKLDPSGTEEYKKGMKIYREQRGKVNAILKNNIASATVVGSQDDFNRLIKVAEDNGISPDDISLAKQKFQKGLNSNGKLIRSAALEMHRIAYEEGKAVNINQADQGLQPQLTSILTQGATSQLSGDPVSWNIGWLRANIAVNRKIMTKVVHAEFSDILGAMLNISDSKLPNEEKRGAMAVEYERALQLKKLDPSILTSEDSVLLTSLGFVLKQEGNPGSLLTSFRQQGGVDLVAKSNPRIKELNEAIPDPVDQVEARRLYSVLRATGRSESESMESVLAGYKAITIDGLGEVSQNAINRFNTLGVDNLEHLHELIEAGGLGEPGTAIGSILEGDDVKVVARDGVFTFSSTEGEYSMFLSKEKAATLNTNLTTLAGNDKKTELENAMQAFSIRTGQTIDRVTTVIGKAWDLAGGEPMPSVVAAKGSVNSSVNRIKEAYHKTWDAMVTKVRHNAAEVLNGNKTVSEGLLDSINIEAEFAAENSSLLFPSATEEQRIEIPVLIKEEEDKAKDNVSETPTAEDVNTSFLERVVKTVTASLADAVLGKEALAAGTPPTQAVVFKNS